MEILNSSFKILNLNFVEIQMAGLKQTKENYGMSVKCWNLTEVFCDFSLTRQAVFDAILFNFM